MLNMVLQFKGLQNQQSTIQMDEPKAAVATTTATMFLALGDTDENRGVVSETFTIHLYRVPKEVLRKQVALFGEWAGDGKPMSFTTGLFAGIEHSFEIKLFPDLSGIRVNYPEVLLKNNKKLEISGIKMSFLEDGVLINTFGMEDKIDAKQENSKYKYFYLADNLDNTNWPETANELKFDITVAKYTHAQLVNLNELADMLPTGPMDSKTTTGMLEFGKYYLSEEFSDVTMTIKCGEETYPAHLIILSLNSPVFAKMFTQNTMEAREKRVEIEDADPKVLIEIEMLRYFYTGKVEDMDKFGVKLYELADRYLVDKLKAFSTNTLLNHINMKNVVEVYCFARKHQNQLLTIMAKRVLKINKKTCFKNPVDLQAFIAAAPDDFGMEIYQTLIEQ